MNEKIPEFISVNADTFYVSKLLGKGKGGYSYLVIGPRGKKYVVKQIHHEPCDYYHFDDKLKAEVFAYDRLMKIGIPMPKFLAVDIGNERILKEYIPGDTVDVLVRQGRMKPEYYEQIHAMCEKLYAANTNIDYYPTNFVARKNGKLYYIDYECNDYMEQWDFEHWGSKYWSRTPEFEDAFCK